MSAQGRPGLSRFRVLWVLLAFVIFVQTNRQLDHRFGAGLPGIFSIMYFPRGPAVNFVTGGFRQFTADLLYLWAIQYYGHYENQDRYVYLRHIFDLISDLDPLYTDPYRLAALICAVELRDIDGCARYFIDRGLEKVPTAWEIAHDGAYFCWTFKRDLDCVEKYLDRARRAPGAPQYFIRWYAKVKAHKGNLALSYEMWRELMEKGDAYTRQVAQIHVHDLGILLLAQRLHTWVVRYYRRFGRYPAHLRDLTALGYHGPFRDPEGRPFVYDPTTGRVLPDRRSLWSYGRILDRLKF